VLFSFSSVFFFYNFWNIWWNKKYSDSKITFFEKQFRLKICSIRNMFTFEFHIQIREKCSNSNFFKLEFVQIRICSNSIFVQIWICSNSILLRFEFVQTWFCSNADFWIEHFLNLNRISNMNRFLNMNRFSNLNRFWIWTYFESEQILEFKFLSVLNRFRI
jgi:hypothetical protein